MDTEGRHADLQGDRRRRRSTSSRPGSATRWAPASRSPAHRHGLPSTSTPPYLLDPARLRPGRAGRRGHVLLPNRTRSSATVGSIRWPPTQGQAADPDPVDAPGAARGRRRRPRQVGHARRRPRSSCATTARWPASATRASPSSARSASREAVPLCAAALAGGVSPLAVGWPCAACRRRPGLGPGCGRRSTRRRRPGPTSTGAVFPAAEVDPLVDGRRAPHVKALPTQRLAAGLVPPDQPLVLGPGLRRPAAAGVPAAAVASG